MAADLRTELEDFYEFVGEQVRARAARSPEDVLEEWRHLHPDDELHAESGWR